MPVGREWKGQRTVDRPRVTRKVLRRVAVTAALVAASAGGHLHAAAQFVRAVPPEDRSIYVSVEKPFYVEDDFGSLASQFEAGVAVRTRPGVAVFGNLAFSYADGASRPSSLTLSNLEAGLLFGRPGGAFGTISLTLPVSRAITDAGYAAEAGSLADPEKPEQFSPDALSYGLSVTRRWTLHSGVLVGGSGGLRVFTPNGRASQFYARYAAFAERSFGSLRGGAEVTGSTILNGGRGSLARRTVNQLTLYGGAPERRSWPYVYLRLPIDNQAQAVTEVTVGLRFVF